VNNIDFDIGPGRVVVAAARVGADIALRELRSENTQVKWEATV